MKLGIGAAAAVSVAVTAAAVVSSRSFEESALAALEAEGRRGETARRDGVDCLIEHGPCRKQVAGGALALDVMPRPVRAMRELTFVVRADSPLASGELSLAMPGMFMGENRVALRPGDDGALVGRGVIVRCPSGRRAWSAAVQARAASGEAFAATFTFEHAE